MPLSQAASTCRRSTCHSSGASRARRMRLTNLGASVGLTNLAMLSASIGNDRLSGCGSFAC
eukprot:scaffold69576_cov45-Phaeocystis_antarctica.AAC.1